jgi:catechol 2,3-dioxygenase-like lactoylglutathione lyase family enzyme
VLKKATRFYEEVLGLEKKYEFSSHVGFECGGLEIGLMPPPKGKAQHTASAIVEFLVSNVDEVYSKLRAKGVKFTNESTKKLWVGNKQPSRTQMETFLKLCR